MSIAERAIKVIAERTGKPATAIHPDQTIRGDLLDDSLAHVELIMGLEDEFLIELSDDDALALRTVQHVIDHLATRGVAA